MNDIVIIVLALWWGGFFGMLFGMWWNPKINFSWQLRIILAFAWPVALPIFIYDEVKDE